jgi:hypothetical protein
LQGNNENASIEFMDKGFRHNGVWPIVAEEACSSAIHGRAIDFIHRDNLAGERKLFDVRL